MSTKKGESAAFLPRTTLGFIAAIGMCAAAATASAAELAHNRPLTDAERARITGLRNETETVRLFVRLDQPAVAETQAQSLRQSGAPASLEACSSACLQGQIQLQRDGMTRVSAQHTQVRAALQSLGARVLASYHSSINGFSVVVRASEIGSVKQIPGVLSVTPVRTVTLDPLVTTPAIDAQIMRSAERGGEGVKIGIIDTGIDYTHAAFGGSGNPTDYLANDPRVVEPGSFPVAGSAIKGGIDLAGGESSGPDAGVPDNDPLDTQMHGTHVAGIVAGRELPGSLAAGLAPGADVYAIKVFPDRRVTTSEDLVVSGIEWAMDPNGDGDLSDHMDVINLSVGGMFGEPDAPAAVAAENAVAIGIIVVAAAGNSGDMPYVVGAPAVAPSVISVAASSPDQSIASFSSRGPGSVDSNFKPDLAAPGVSIVSAFKGSGTGGIAISGTSMASPYVAGTATLLRQRHPDLDVAAIKALLQNSTAAAVPGDTALTRQGAGLVRVDRAVALTSLAQPGGVSFGRINPLALAVKTEQVSITNISSARRTYFGRDVSRNTLRGVTVICPRVVTVGSSRTVKAQITLAVNPRSAAPDEWYQSQTEVDGWCVLSDGIDELRIAYMAVVDPASMLVVAPTTPVRKKSTVLNVGPSVGFAEGFTLAKLDGELSDGTSSSIAAVGFRRADPARYQGLQVLELGVATEAPIRNLLGTTFLMQIDVNKDGALDHLLLGAPLDPVRQPGRYATFQFDLNTAEVVLDWEPVQTWDYNDRVFILPFTLQASGGLVPEQFDYALDFIVNDSGLDFQQGTIDLTKEMIPDLNSFSVDPLDRVNVTLSGSGGQFMWLFPNNRPAKQMSVVISR